jgi:thioredoxin 1
MKLKFLSLFLSVGLMLSAASYVLSEDGFKEKDAREERLNRHTLARVNGGVINEEYFDERFEQLPEQYKGMYQMDKPRFLEQLITEELLWQEAVRLGFVKEDEAWIEEHQRMMILQQVIEHACREVSVTDEEVRQLYDVERDKMEGVSFDEIKIRIREYLLAQKKNQVMNSFIEGLYNHAYIVRNEKWIIKQNKSAGENPLDVALASGKPTIVDFGASTCVPCKMMKPIVEELQNEYRGRANILLIEIYDYRKLAAQYGVRAIPTQIFFDAEGKETWRHEGFLSKEEIVKQLDELGVQ